MLSSRSVPVTVVAIALLASACSGSQRRGGSGPNGSGPDIRQGEVAAVDVHPTDTAAPVGTAESDALVQMARGALDAQHRTIAGCYATALQSARDAAGAVTVTATFGLDGHAQVASATVAGEGGLASARACIEAAVREARIEPPPSQAIMVSRRYNFSNPLTEITVGTPLAVTPPRRGVRPPTAPAAGTEGPLTETDAQSVVVGHYADLQTCYTILARVMRNAAGTATLVMSVNQQGAVTEASVADAQESISGINECLVTVAQGLTFRAAPLNARIRYPLSFAPR